MAKKGNLVAHWESMAHSTALAGPAFKVQYGLRDDSAGKLRYSSEERALVRRKGPETLAVVKNTGFGWKRTKPAAGATDPAEFRRRVLKAGYIELAWDAAAIEGRSIK